MKKFLLALAFALGIFLGGVSIAGAVSILLPVQGGTGTAVKPTLGQLLIGLANGKYAPGTSLPSLTITSATTTNATTTTISISGAGAVTAPSVWVQSAGGLYKSNTNELGLTNGVSSVRWDGTSFYPGTTDVRDLGSFAGRWNNIYGIFLRVTSSGGTATTSIFNDSTSHLVVKSATTTGDLTQLSVIAPDTAGREANLATIVTPPDTGGTRTFEFDNQDNAQRQVDLTETISGGAQFSPWMFQMCASGACVPGYSFAPSGAQAIGVTSSTLLDNSALLQLASTTATRLLEVDTARGTHQFVVANGSSTISGLLNVNNASTSVVSTKSLYFTNGSSTNLYTSGQTILAGVGSNVGIGTTSPPEKLTTWCSTGYCTNRIQSANTYGGMWAYDGDNTVNVGSISNSTLNEIYNNYISGRTYSSNSQNTIHEIDAPSGNPQEANLSLVRNTDNVFGGTNREFSDINNESYGGYDHVDSWVVGKQGTGTLRPFGIRFWNQNLGNVAERGVWTFLTDPSGATALGAFSTTTYDKKIPLQVASSTASTLFAVDATPGTHKVVVQGTGDVGIGTTTPGDLLDIQGEYPALRIFNTNASQFAGAGFYLMNKSTTLGNQSGTSLYQGINDGSATQGYFAIDQVNNAGAFVNHTLLADYSANTLALYTAGTARLSIAGTGGGTTTVTGLNVNGSATSTSNVGFNITSGCFSIAGVCLSAGLSTAVANTWTALQTFTGGFFATNGTTTNATSTTLSVSGASVLGTTTTASLNGTVVVDGVHYPATGAGIKSAVADGCNKTVYVPAGTYTFTSSDGFNFGGCSTKLVGANASTTILKANGTSIIYDFFGSATDPKYRNGIEITGFTFDMQMQNAQSAIQMGSSKDLYIHDNVFTNNKGIWNVAIGSIAGTLGSETAANIAVSSSTNLTFSHNTVASSTDSTYEAVLCTNCSNGQFINNTFRNITQGAAPLAIYGYSRNMSVIGNTFDQNTINGPYIQQSDNVIFSNNNFYTDTTTLPNLKVNNSTKIKVINNNFNGEVRISDANFTTFDGHINRYDDSSQIEIRGNTFSKYYSAIRVADFTDTRVNEKDIQILNNIFDSSNGGWSQILVGNASTTGMKRITIAGNIASTSSYFDVGGITITGSTTNTALLSDLDIHDNYLSPSTAGGNSAGIYVEGASNVRIYNNKTSGTGKGSWSDIQVGANTSNISQQSFTSTGFGVGTSTPGSLLSLQGIANFSTATSTFYSSGGLNLTGGGCFAISGVCLPNSAVSSQWTTSGSNIYYTTGKVGVGTTTPDSGLTVQGSGQLLHVGDDHTNDSGTKLLIENRWTGAGGYGLVVQRNSTTPQFVVDGNSNVGVSTTTPVTNFSVTGNGYFTGGLGVGLLNTTAGTLQTSGLANIGGTLTVTGNSTLANATSTGLYASNTFGLNSSYFTSLTGSGLSNSSGALTCTTANGSTFGCLTNTDWGNFNNKISSSSLSATFPLNYNSSTGAFTFSGISTSSAPTIGNLPYWTGVNTLGTVATSSFGVSASFSYSGTLGNFVGGSNGTLSIANGGVSNAMLALSTIGATSPNSTISFGSAAALGSTFTGDINLGTGNVWTAASTTFSGGLTFTTGTSSSATSTSFFATTASSTNLFGTTGNLSTLAVNNTSAFTGLGTFANGLISQASSTFNGNFTLATGKFGMGISNPTYNLTVLQSVGDGSVNGIQLENSASSATGRNMLDFYNINGGGFSSGRVSSDVGSGFTNSKLYFSVANSSKALVDRMVIDVNGNVGIGTSTPYSKFHVSAGGSGTGAVSTTTVNFGEVGTTTSHACFNTKNTVGTDISFYFVGTTLTVESNLCR